MTTVADLATISDLLEKYREASALSVILDALSLGDNNTSDAYFVMNDAQTDFITPAGPPYASGYKLIYVPPAGGDPQEFMISVFAASTAMTVAQGTFHALLVALGVDPDA